MANTKRVQLRRGTTAEHAVFTGAEGELTIDVTRDIAVVHDGATPGGHELVGVAATSQTIVNKDGLAIGSSTLVDGNELTVIGSAYISGETTLGGISPSTGVKVGQGNTDFIVDGTARVTGTLSVGENTVVINGNTNTIIADNAVFNRVSITGEEPTIQTYVREVSNLVSIGSTIVPLNSISNLIVGDLLSISGIFSNVPIVGFSTISVPTYYVDIALSNISTTVSVGSTIIGLSIISGVVTDGSVSYFLRVGEDFDNVPIVGFTTVSTGIAYSTIVTTSISTSVSPGSTQIAIGSTIGATVGDYLFVDGIFNGVEIVGLTTLALPSYIDTITTTAVSDNVSAGSTIIPLFNTSGIITGVNAYLNIAGVFENVLIVGVTTNNEVLIGIGSTSPNPISIATTATIGIIQNPVTDIAVIGAGDTSALPIATGTVAYIKELIPTQSPAVIIGAANTVGYAITIGSSASITLPKDTLDAVLIGAANTSSSSISLGSTVNIIRQQPLTSNLNVNNFKSVGITTLEQLILGQLNFPSTDGLKGQVLITDGAGNIDFGIGGGSGGSEVILRVSSETGSDDNDGKILPLKTIKKATQLASKVGKPVTIFVETGEYHEDNPIIVYDSVSVIGDSLRNIIVRPLNAGKDLFKVRNGCYITGMSFNDYVDVRGVPQHTYDYAIAFDDPYDTSINRTGYAATNTALEIIGATYDHATGFTTFTTASPHELAREYSVKLTGIGWTCGYDEIGISTFVYDNVSGVSTITFFSDALFTPSGSGNTQKGYKIGDKLFLNNLPFACGAEHAGVTTTIFPYTGLDPVYGSVYPITGINTAAKTVTIAGAASTIPHIYEGYPTVAISTFSYDHVSGIATAVTTTPHGFDGNDRISLAGLEFSCAAQHSGITTTIFPDGTVTDYSPDGYTFKVGTVINSTTFEYYVGVSTIAHTYVSGGTVKKVPTVQEVWYYPDYHKDGQNEFGVVSVASSTVFTIRGQVTPIDHYYTQGGTLRLTRPIINKSPYIQNCSILSSLGGNGIFVDGDKVAKVNKGILPELGENPAVGDQPEFGKSMVAATFTMISFGGIGWRTINDGYAQVVSCFQIFCRYGSLTQSGGYLSITNSATNFGDKALRSTGFSRNSFVFDRGRVVANGTQDGYQTLTAIGYGRSDQELYVCRFIDRQGVDRTANFKPLTQFKEFTNANVNYEENIFNIPAHPFINGESVVYSGNEDAQPKQVVGGLIDDASYYVGYIDASNFKLYEDEGLQTLVDLTGSFTGVNTFTKNNQEFFNYEMLNRHNSYQKLTLTGIGSTAIFVSGRQVTNGQAIGYALTYNQSTRDLIVSLETVAGEKIGFSTQLVLNDHSPSPISVGVATVVGINTYWTLNFKVESTSSGQLISGINSLTENYALHFHRPSIINSSAHTWEYSGSGTDYNALPQNGGQPKANSEQVSELGGRVYASGTNELGDFKIGTQITAFNRTGNIIFNNKVTIGELASIRLSLSGGVAVDEFSTDQGLGDAETGGAKNSRVPTQLAVKAFLTNRLGSFIDKQVSTNAIPNAVVQLNAQGQINADLIPPQVVTFNLTNVGGGRTVLVNQIPAINIKQGDTIVEPEDSFVLVNDVLSQYLILDNHAEDYTFQQGDVITSALTESVTGIVTTPPNGIGIGTQVQNYVGYGSTGLVKGVLLNLEITTGGSGYANPGIYTGISLTTLTGIGQSAYGSVTIGAGLTATFISAFAGGRGYAVGDVVTAADSLLGGRSGGAQFQATVKSVETRLYVKLTNNQKFTGSAQLADYIQDTRAVSISTSLTADYTVDIDPTDVGTGGSIDFAEDRIVVGVGHQFGTGDPVIYDANSGVIIGASGNGILNRATYYANPVGVSSIELYYDYALINKLNFTGSGIGTHTIRRNAVNVHSGRVIFTNHGFATGTPFRVSGNTPTGITTGLFYYIGGVTLNSFTFHGTQADALLSVNGTTFSPVAIGSTNSGTFTLTEQNVKYNATVNTSSQSLSNFSLLAQDSIDAANIVSGVISPTRLGSGVANDFTFLSGSSSYEKVVTSIGIGTTQPISATSTSAVFAPNGIGINTYFGHVNLVLNRVSATGTDDYTSLGVSRFKKSTFSIGSDGEIQIKGGSSGDVDANALQGQAPAYYLNAANHTGSVPITRGGTGLTGVPADGAILIGNGSAYSLTTTPIFKGNVSVQATLSATTITETSDARIKENIKTLENCLDKVLKLRGVEYDLISEGTHKIGLIAQEVEDIIPEVVTENETTSYKAVSYGNLVALLIEAIKELKSEVSDIKKKLDL